MVTLQEMIEFLRVWRVSHKFPPKTTYTPAELLFAEDCVLLLRDLPAAR